MNFQKTIYEWRVRTGFLGIILAIILARPNIYSLVCGIGLTIIGLSIRTWACGHIKKGKELATSGPYRHTRNPLYLGNLFLGAGVVLASRSLWLFAFFIIYFLLFYSVVINWEREKMNEIFPQEYKEYRKKVPLFIPSTKRSFPLNKISFSWKLYKKNKEYRALVGTVVFWLIIAVKIIIWRFAF